MTDRRTGPIRLRRVYDAAGFLNDGPAAALVGAVVGLLLGPALAALTRTAPTGDRWLTWAAVRGVPATTRRIVLLAVSAALVLGLIGARLGWRADLPAYLFLGALGVTLAAIDFDTHRLPNPLTYTGFLLGVVYFGLLAAARGDAHPLLRAALCAFVVLVVFFCFTVAGGMGLGDTKLLTVLALYLGWIGWTLVVDAVLAGFLLGGLHALELLVVRRAGWNSHFAYGPALLAGALVALLVSSGVGDFSA